MPNSHGPYSYMSKLGYPTLAIDRLGAGLSDHPDPITEVQANLQTNIHHEIVQMARAGTIPGVDKSFTKIIFVGGSYGSILGNQQAIQYPDDLDALLLTAYTNDDQVSKGCCEVQCCRFTHPLFPVAPRAHLQPPDRSGASCHRR